MEEIKKFSPEVCAALNYYVYRLVDPRNGQTFYVGKGRNNRVFAHTECALANYNDVDYSPDVDDEENLKYRTIREIKDAGLEVLYIIQKYGLEERDAFFIESVLIDIYSIERKLTNKIKGFKIKGFESEPGNALTLQRDLAAEEYIDSPQNPKYMIIKVKDYWLNQRNNDRYECTRSAWRLNLNQARKYPYVLSVTNGIVKEVYKVNEWYNCNGNSGRIEFIGQVAEPSVRAIFINKKIPEKYRKPGQQSPCLYCKVERE